MITCADQSASWSIFLASPISWIDACSHIITHIWCYLGSCIGWIAYLQMNQNAEIIHSIPDDQLFFKREEVCWSSATCIHLSNSVLHSYETVLWFWQFGLMRHQNFRISLFQVWIGYYVLVSSISGHPSSINSNLFWLFLIKFYLKNYIKY